MTTTDVFDLRTLEPEELQQLYDATCTKPENEILAAIATMCGEMLAAYAGTVVFLRPGGRDLDFEKFKTTDLHEAQTQFRILARSFKAANQRTAQTFCEMIILRCRGGLEARSVNKTAFQPESDED